MSIWNFTKWSKVEEAGRLSREGCLFLHPYSGEWHDLECDQLTKFFCKVETSKQIGNKTITLSSSNILYGSFNLWWINNPSINSSRVPGVRLSWHIKGGIAPANMEAYIVDASSGKLSTPRVGSEPPAGYQDTDHTFSAAIGSPANIGNGSWVVEINMDR